MKNARLLPLLALFALLSCERSFSKKEIEFQTKLYGKEWIEIKRRNVFGGLYSNYGERYQADWDLKIDSSGFVQLKTPTRDVRNILFDTDSLLKWDKYRYRVLTLKPDTLVLQYIPNKGDTVNKPHNLTFIPKTAYDKLSFQQKNFSALSKIDTLFIQKLADSCKRNPLYRFCAETFPQLIPLVSNVEVDTTVTQNGFHKEIEYNIKVSSPDIKYQHSYSGKFIIRENGQLAAFDVGLMTLPGTGDEILPGTFKYIEHFMKNNFQYIPGTTLGIQHNTYVYFTFNRRPEHPEVKSDSTKQVALR